MPAVHDDAVARRGAHHRRQDKKAGLEIIVDRPIGPPGRAVVGVHEKVAPRLKLGEDPGFEIPPPSARSSAAPDVHVQPRAFILVDRRLNFPGGLLVHLPPRLEAVHVLRLALVSLDAAQLDRGE